MGLSSAAVLASLFVGEVRHQTIQRLTHLGKVTERRGIGGYATIREKSTGVGAFEILIDRANGRVIREPGPDMIWNTRLVVPVNETSLSREEIAAARAAHDAQIV